MNHLNWREIWGTSIPWRGLGFTIATAAAVLTVTPLTGGLIGATVIAAAKGLG